MGIKTYVDIWRTPLQAHFDLQRVLAHYITSFERWANRDGQRTLLPQFRVDFQDPAAVTADHLI